MAAPLKVVNSYVVGGVAPHVLTTRWTYTVPAGRFAIVELMFIRLVRQTAPAPVGFAHTFINYQPSGGVMTTILAASEFAGSLAYQDGLVWGSELRLMAGDTLEAATIDPSTGGTIRYDATMVATEYDA